MRFLGHVQHVRGEEGLASLLEVLLAGLDHAVHPGEQLFGAMVRVGHGGDTVVLGHSVDVMGTGNGT